MWITEGGIRKIQYESGDQVRGARFNQSRMCAITSLWILNLDALEHICVELCCGCGIPLNLLQLLLRWVLGVTYAWKCCLLLLLVEITAISSWLWAFACFVVLVAILFAVCCPSCLVLPAFHVHVHSLDIYHGYLCGIQLDHLVQLFQGECKLCKLHVCLLLHVLAVCSVMSLLPLCSRIMSVVATLCGIQWNLFIMDTLGLAIYGSFLLLYRGFPLSEVKM